MVRESNRDNYKMKTQARSFHTSKAASPTRRTRRSESVKQRMLKPTILLTHDVTIIVPVELWPEVLSWLNIQHGYAPTYKSWANIFIVLPEAVSIAKLVQLDEHSRSFPLGRFLNQCYDKLYAEPLRGTVELTFRSAEQE